MESLGEPREIFAEFFRWVERQYKQGPRTYADFPPANHGNLLASSSRHGYLLVASNREIYLHLLQGLRNKTPGDLPESRLDLGKYGVKAILDITFALNDAALVVRAVPEGEEDPCALVLSTAMLAKGRAALFNGPPLQKGLKAVAVCPQSFTMETKESSGEEFNQLVALLYGETKVELHAIGTGMPDPGAATSDQCSFNAPGPVTSLALSPEDRLLAVGAMRGSVGIHDPKSGALLHNITEIESGWSPFSLHFLDNEALMVSYVRGQDVSHVVWNLVKDGDSLTVKGHSFLGELCLPLHDMFPSSSGEEDGDDENESKPPVIWCHRIPGWDICIVASSKSDEMELIALNENGVWENWKPDEGKMANLPTDENDADTFPIGIALDLTDTDPVDATEPGLPPLNPMPRVIAFTSHVLLLPFSLVDDRADAGCRLIAEPRRIQKTPAEPKPMETLAFPEDSAAESVLSAAESSGQEEDHEVPSLPLQEQMAQKPLVEQPFPPLPPVQMPTLPTPTSKTTSDFSASSLESEQMPPAGEVTPKDDFGSTLRPPFGVPTSTSAPETLQDVRDRKSDSGASSVLNNRAFPSFSASVLTRDVPIVVPEQLKPTDVGQISFPVGEPGDFGSSIRMVLDEMRTELSMNRIMEESTQRMLFTANEQMMPHIETVKSALAELLDVLRKRFHEEASLRREMLTSLKDVNALSLEFGSASLEFKVREEEGFVSHLQAEDKIMDDSIVKKEADILRSISAIERKLSISQNRKPSRLGHAEQVQQIYSSLSLQGIRVKKLRGLLSALSDRIDELDRGGRLTDLGLSMARLEKLSINRIKSPTMNLRHGSRGLRSAERGPGEKFVPKVSSMPPTHPYNSEESLLPGDIQNVLRRLAMTDGRAVIVVKGPQGERRRAEEMSEGRNRFAPDQAEQSLRPGAFYASVASSNGHGQQNIDMTSNRRSETIHSVKGNQTPSFAPQQKESSSASNRAVPSGKRSASASRDPAGTAKEGVGHERGAVPSLASSGNISSNLPEHERAGAEEATSKRAFYPPSTSNQSTAREVTSKPMTKPKVPSAGMPRTRVPADAADLFGTSDSVPTVVASSSQSLNAGESPFSLKPVTSGRRQSTNKPPILPHGTDTFASLPPEPPGMQRKRPLRQEYSQSAEARAAGTIPVAFLPPDPDSSITSSPNPLSNGTKKVSAAQEQSPKVNESPFAALPPEDDRKEVPFASLPPDDDLTLNSSAVVSAGSDPKKKQREDPIPREKVTSTPFAALPPHEDVKPNPVTSQNLSTGPTTETIPQLDITTQSSPPFGIDSGESNTFGVFGNKLAPEAKPTASLFGTAKASESKSKSQEESGGMSLFATATQSTALQFSNSFSAAFPTQPAEPATSQDNAPANESLPPIDADSSDSDGEEGIRREGGFGAMPASKFNAPREQTFQGVGTQAAFGQASTSPFATTGTQSGQTSAFSSLTQQNTGPGTSAFTSDASGQTSGFGAPSTLGGGASLGFGSQLGASTQPGAILQFGQGSQLGGAMQFGANSQLGAGFGAQSSLGGGQSPFATQPAPAPSGFGSGAPPFASGMSNVRFGESTFGAPQTGFPGGGASPFPSSGAAFGGQSGGISGFAALAASQPSDGGGSGFGNGMTPIFGNSQGPPAFTSPAFSQRRA